MCIWQLSLVHGYGGVPNLREFALPPRLVLFLHCITTGSLTALAAGLGALIEHRHDHLPASVRWVLCASFAGYVVIAALAALVARPAEDTRASWTGLLGRLLPPLTVTLAVGFVGDELPSVAVVWLLAAAAVWALLGHVAQRGGHALHARMK
ncbi:hypothetical protein VSR01_27625 [Actinacidiphila sp. DG2A-62]|uniref:hypothetical protein n=1 Tax=Actinacidiphila sp. DG2A-62 TaxID=3108821 RepID=UPI002DC039A9|nr:hypothetical protein [Actinacidiphila sp. DG2A-62]MEC3997072.1 hypothetical protein [Actinacidiphila sp. DG2A-62]